MKKYAVGIILGGTIVCAIPAHAENTEYGTKWTPHIDLEAKPGTKRNLGETDLFLPLWQNNNTLLFGNIRARMDDNDSREGNFGIALRQMQDNGWNLGGYGYYDHRISPHGNGLNQATLGIEALSFDWDLRANAYVPFGRTSHLENSSDTVDFSGASITFNGGEERAMRGFDAEIGWRVPVFKDNAGQQLRLYGGGYRFTDDLADTIQGPRGRLDLTFDEVPFLWEGSRFTLGAEIQHDTPRGTQSFASFRLRIPLQVFGEKPSRPLTAMERRMADPIIRDVDIVSQSGTWGTAETITETSDGSSLTLISADTTSGADLAAAITAAGANSTVIISGKITNMNTLVALQSGQTIIGQGELTFKTPSGRTITTTTPGGTFSGIGGFSGSGLKTMISMADNSTITGMTLTSTSAGTLGSGMIYVDGVTGAKIIENTMTSISASNTAIAIEVLNNATDTVIRNNTLIASSSGLARGMMLRGSTNTVFENNTINVSGGGTLNLLSYSGTNNNVSGSGNVGNVPDCTGTPTSGSISFTTTNTCP